VQDDRGRGIADMARQHSPHIVPVDLLRGTHSLRRRGLVAGIDQLLQDEEAFAEGGEERMVRDDAQRGERLVAQLRPFPRGSRRWGVTAAGLGVRRGGHQAKLGHGRTRRRVVRLVVRVVRVQALLVRVATRGQFTVRIARRYVTSVVARRS